MDLRVLRGELEAYGVDLLAKPSIIVLNKIDRFAKRYGGAAGGVAEELAGDLVVVSRQCNLEFVIKKIKTVTELASGLETNFLDVFELVFLEQGLDPDARSGLAECADGLGMKGLVLYPNYHEYALADPALEPLMTEAARRGWPVCVQAGLEDPRRQFRAHKVAEVPAAEIGDLARAYPEVKVVALGLKVGQPESAGEPLPDDFDEETTDVETDEEAADDDADEAMSAEDFRDEGSGTQT